MRCNIPYYYYTRNKTPDLFGKLLENYRKFYYTLPRAVGRTREYRPKTFKKCSIRTVRVE